MFEQSQILAKLGTNKRFADGYHCYYAGGNRGNCRYEMDTVDYIDWHDGYTVAEWEDTE
jgi:hypothetical protein